MSIWPAPRSAPARSALGPGGRGRGGGHGGHHALRQYLVRDRITVYDAGDLEVTATMGGRLEAIDARQPARLAAGAMSAEAVNYRLEVKWAE